ncbi:MAG: hypothetical protein ACPHK8_06135 [Thermoplasmatota archaeon]
MTWNEQLKAEVPRTEIPAFLSDLQAMVSALREGREPRATSLLRAHAALALAYMDEGAKKEKARALLRAP